MSRIRVLVMASVTAGVLLGVFGGAAGERELRAPLPGPRPADFRPAHHCRITTTICRAPRRRGSAARSRTRTSADCRSRIIRRRRRAFPAARAARSRSTAAPTGRTRAG